MKILYYGKQKHEYASKSYYNIREGSVADTFKGHVLSGNGLLKATS